MWILHKKIGSEREKRIRLRYYHVVGRTPNLNLIALPVYNEDKPRSRRLTSRARNRPRCNDCSAKSKELPPLNCTNHRVCDHLSKAKITSIIISINIRLKNKRCARLLQRYTQFWSIKSRKRSWFKRSPRYFWRVGRR